MSNKIQHPNRLLDKEGLSYLWTKIKSALSGKADKAPNATDGNFASLDAGGNLKDSGHKHSDYADAIALKANKEDTVLETTLSRGRKANTTIGAGSFAFGYSVTSANDYSHAEGYFTESNGYASHAEGTACYANGDQSHAEGDGAYASGESSHAEGHDTKASGNYSHAEGESGTASGVASHVEGTTSYATGNYAHAEGRQTTSSGVGAHSEGKGTNAAGNYSHAEGEQTTAYAQSSHVVGRYNSADTYLNWPTWTASESYEVGDKVQRVENGTRHGYICKTANSDAEFDSSNWDSDVLMNFVEIVGNGKNNNNKSNARAVDWNGNEYLQGNLNVFCSSNSTGGISVATQLQINSIETEIEQIKENIAIVQNEDTASTNISAGQYVCWAGTLFKAATAITSGESFTPQNLTHIDNGGLNDLSKVTTWSGSGLTITRCGNVCQVVVNVSKNVSTWSSVFVCTVPQGFRPKAQVKFAIFGDMDYSVGFQINTDGNAYLCSRKQALTTSWIWYGGTTYICTE